MKTTKRSKKRTEEEIDSLVESQAQAEDDSAWEKPVQVRRPRLASVKIPPELASRAAFLAKLHREKSVEDWLAKVIKDRVELEELAFMEAKREILLRNGA